MATDSSSADETPRGAIENCWNFGRWSYRLPVRECANPFMARRGWMPSIETRYSPFRKLRFWQFDVPFNHSENLTHSPLAGIFCYESEMIPQWKLVAAHAAIIPICGHRIQVQSEQSKSTPNWFIACECGGRIRVGWNSTHSTAVPSRYDGNCVCALLHYAWQLAAWLAVNWLYPIAWIRHIIIGVHCVSDFIDVSALLLLYYFVAAAIFPTNSIRTRKMLPRSSLYL